MENLVIDFKNVVAELESKKLKLCYFKNGHFVEDAQGNYYAIDILYHGSYLDRLIKNGNAIEFNRTDASLNQSLTDNEKLAWGAEEVEAFIEQHSL